MFELVVDGLANQAIALRSVAISSNVAFIAYALDARPPPVLVLHAILLPVNLWRRWLWKTRSDFT